MSNQKHSSGGRFNIVLDQESWDILTRSVYSSDPYKKAGIYNLVDQIRYRTNLPPRPGVQYNIK